MKTEEPEAPPQAKRARVALKAAPGVIEVTDVSRPEYVEDDSIMREPLPMLRSFSFGRRGNRLNPEQPRLAAKIRSEEGKGELWLAPLPTEQRMETIIETKHSIQIYCFLKDPTAVQVEPGGEWGMHIAEALVIRCEMSNPHN